MTGTRYLERSAARVPEVARTWTQSLSPDSKPYSQRVVPDGCIDVIWSRSRGELEVAGPDTAAFLAELKPGETLVGVRFRPGTAPPALGVPAEALRDAHPPLRELWGHETDALAEALAGAVDPEAALLAAVERRLRSGDPGDPAVGAMVAALRGPCSVRQASERLGFSERQFRRRSLAAFGYPPKTLQRVLRFQRAVSLARSGMPFAEVAQTVGYADQPHLAHEVRELAGVPLSGLLAG